MKSISHLLCIALLTACPGFLIADDPVGDPIQAHLIAPEILLHHRAEIGLTDQQIKKIQALVEEAGPKSQQHQTQLNDALGKLTQLLAAPKIDANAALGQLDEVLGIEKELKRMHLRVLIQIRSELNAEQQEIAENLRRGPPNTNNLEQRLKAKVARIEKEIQLRFQAGRAPQDVIDSLQEFSSLMQSGQVKEAEALLDHLLETLGVKDAVKAADSTVWEDAGEQSSPATPASSKAAATSVGAKVPHLLECSRESRGTGRADRHEG